MECEGDGELRLACKLAAEDHNRWQQPDDTCTVVEETLRMEEDARNRLNQEADEEEDQKVCEEEDITLEEWSQLGYKWFKKDEMVYI